ncbi:hypothetical protein ABW20_dc0108318 [Dactylellina cionopaga]|nr:hypothetical protein ABW20_dc0108318 [Dactylellina cionopaga]
MAVFHQSAGRKRRTGFLNSYLRWISRYDKYALYIFAADALLTTMYFAVSIFMAVYYFATLDFLQEVAVGKDGYGQAVSLLKARAAIAITIAYFCLCAFYWLTTRLTLPPTGTVPTFDIDKLYEIYVRMYSIYSEAVLQVKIPASSYVVKPFYNDNPNKVEEYIVGDVMLYFWRWSFFLLVTACITLLAFLINPDFVSLCLYPETITHRNAREIFDLIFFTATQPFWTMVDILFLLCEVVECLCSCVYELAFCRRPKPQNSEDPSQRQLMVRIRYPKDYKEPRLSAAYYWANWGIGCAVKGIQSVWHWVKTNVLSYWYNARFWGMKISWGLKQRKSRASDITNTRPIIIRGPFPSDIENGNFDIERNENFGRRGRSDRRVYKEEIEMCDMVIREYTLP